MLEFVQEMASDRKLRLYACACIRHGPLAFFSGDSETNRKGVEVVERFVDGLATGDELQRLVDPWDFRGNEDDGWFRLTLPKPFHSVSAIQIGREVASYAGYHATTYNDFSAIRDPMASAMASMLRCIFSPFLSVAVSPSWLRRDVTVLATTIYNDRTFDQMPVLADDLEDAGCDNVEVLTHLRGPGPHVRGCWVVDLLLGKK
jgi:hypothetical protein